MIDLLRKKEESLEEWIAPAFKSGINKKERETWKAQCGSSQ